MKDLKHSRLFNLASAYRITKNLVANSWFNWVLELRYLVLWAFSSYWERATKVKFKILLHEILGIQPGYLVSNPASLFQKLRLTWWSGPMTNFWWSWEPLSTNKKCGGSTSFYLIQKLGWGKMRQINLVFLYSLKYLSTLFIRILLGVIFVVTIRLN